MDVHFYINQAQSRWTHKFSEKTSNQLNLGIGYWGGHNRQGVYEENYDVVPLLIRDEISYSPNDALTLRLGTDTELRWGKVKAKVPGDYGEEGAVYYNTSANDRFLTFKGNRFIGQPGLLGELDLSAIPMTQLVFGTRVDYHSVIDKWGADPRVAVRFEPIPVTTLKAGVGLFHQPPDIPESDRDYGNPDLELTRAIHYSVGIEQRFLEHLELGLEGFYKDLSNVVTLSNDIVERSGEIVPERLSNDATGRVYGMEAQIKHKPSKRFFGWISYTLMRSERFDEPGAPARLFDNDQTHILTAVGNVTIGWGIDIGLTFRLASGNPYTPILGASFDADSDDYVPIYGAINSRRMPLFHQLDVRIDKKWQWKYLAFTLYLDVQNVYNCKNVEGYAYSFNFEQSAVVQGLPILPSLGLKLEY